MTKELEEGNRKRAMARLKVPDRTASVGSKNTWNLLDVWSPTVKSGCNSHQCSLSNVEKGKNLICNRYRWRSVTRI